MLPDEFTPELNEIFNDFEESFIYDSNTYSCFSSSIINETDNVEIGGYMAANQLELVANVAAFTTIPKDLEKITFDGDEWRIIKTEVALGALHLICREETA